MSIITVGTNKQFTTLAAAVAAAKSGDTIDVDSGTYTNDFATATVAINLVAIGGQVTLQDTATMASGTGLLTVLAGATITGFVFEGAHSADGTAAGLLDQGGALVVNSSLFTGDQNGLVAANASGGTVSIEASEFAGNGTGAAASANISVGAVKSLTIDASYIHDANGGSEVKSAALATTITNSRIEDNAAKSGGSIVLPDAGVVSIKNSTIEKGAASASGPVVTYGGTTTYSNSSLTLSGDTIVSDTAAATVLLNKTALTATVTSDVLYGVTSTQIASGPVQLTSDTIATVRPTVSVAPLVAPGAALTTEYGRQGAVVADGTILSVGHGGTYATLAAALAVAHDGDTIQLAAGTYNSDGLTISHKLIIEGVGGMAVFSATTAPSNGIAQFITTADVTFENIAITGVASPGGVDAAIHDEGGNLTVVNSDIYGNQAGIVADAASGTSIGIYDTEVANNGTPDGRGTNVSVAEVGTLTMRNDWVHDAVTGAEVVSRADSTVLDSDRISQATGNGASDLVLPNAGKVSVTNSALQKGINSASAPVISVGSGIPYAGSSVLIANDTLISDMTATTTQFVSAAALANVSVTGTTFVGGNAGSTQVVGGTNTGAGSRTGVEVAQTAPWAANGAPAAGPLTVTSAGAPAASSGVMVLRVSEDAYLGDAKFTVSVDGAQVGGTLTASASHAAGMSQTFTIAGSFAPGAHDVSVQFVNSITAGAAGQRDLYVDGLTFNSVDAGQSAALTANGAATLTTGPITRATAITVNLSEDAWHGDAEAFISIDGKVQGGLTTVTASHTAGATQAMSFLLNLAPGAHTVGVSFLDPAGSGAGTTRDLYVDSIDVAGTHYAAAATALTSTAGSNFAFTVAPPAAANAGLFLTAGLVQPLSTLIPTH